MPDDVAALGWLDVLDELELPGALALLDDGDGDDCELLDDDEECSVICT